MAEEDPTICAVHPFTGRFAFAGIHGADAMEDAVAMANEAGGINGKKIKYYWADGEYKNDVGIAAFKRLYAQHKPRHVGPEHRHDQGPCARRSRPVTRSFTLPIHLPKLPPIPKKTLICSFPGRHMPNMFGILLKYIAKEKPGANIAFFYSDTEFGREPIPAGREMCKKMGLNLVAEEISKVGGVDIIYPDTGYETEKGGLLYLSWICGHSYSDGNQTVQGLWTQV